MPLEIEQVTTTLVQGNFFAEAPSAQTFVAKSGDTPAFGQTFPTINDHLTWFISLHAVA